jgi:hypothetical protein
MPLQQFGTLGQTMPQVFFFLQLGIGYGALPAHGWPVPVGHSTRVEERIHHGVEPWMHFVAIGLCVEYWCGREKRTNFSSWILDIFALFRPFRLFCTMQANGPTDCIRGDQCTLSIM